MKKYTIFALTLVLTAALLAGCRSMGGQTGMSDPTTTPTGAMPTVATTEATNPPTQPTQQHTTPTEATNSTDTTDTTNDSTGPMEGRGRRMIPGMR